LTTVIGETDAEVERRGASTNQNPERLASVGLYGTPATIAERLEAYASLGISRVYLQLLDITDVDQVALIGADLAPRIAAL